MASPSTPTSPSRTWNPGLTYLLGALRDAARAELPPPLGGEARLVPSPRHPAADEEGGGERGTLIVTRDEANGSIDSAKITKLIADVLDV